MSNLISLSTYLGTRTSTSGRPRRTPSVPQKYRGTFTQALDDNGNPVEIYITDEGKIRTDIKTVQDELEASGIFRGIQDGWGVDFDELRESEETECVEADTNGDEFEDDSGPDGGDGDDDDEYLPSEEEEDDDDDEMDDLVDDNDDTHDSELSSQVDEEEDYENDEDYEDN